jgi:hypothetical protein
MRQMFVETEDRFWILDEGEINDVHIKGKIVLMGDLNGDI